jgi:prepilin-type processing-associated H-X9-DG protein/prepilin-type N-terminal cleavage/methylation domain-containing protein
MVFVDGEGIIALKYRGHDMRSYQVRVRHGISLLELLVVIAIISLLIGLLLPAVQKARESSNRLKCMNNLRQMGIALHNAHNTNLCFPSGGWGWGWAGMPDRGSGPDQPGGWLYNILPYIEQQNLHSLGMGQESPQFESSIVEALGIPVSIYNCPSRRSGGPYPVQSQYSSYLVGVGSANTTAKIQLTYAARSDYAANAGSQSFNELFSGPASLAQGDNPSYAWPSTSACNGIFYQRSTVSISQITRGTSNTFLAGERYLNSLHYTDGTDLGDNENMYVGFDNDNYRVTFDPPMKDQPNVSSSLIFGSAHTGGVNMLYADGSVQLVSFAVDPEVFLEAGKRSE